MNHLNTETNTSIMLTKAPCENNQNNSLSVCNHLEATVRESQSHLFDVSIDITKSTKRETANSLDNKNPSIFVIDSLTSLPTGSITIKAPHFAIYNEKNRKSWFYRVFIQPRSVRLPKAVGIILGLFMSGLLLSLALFLKNKHRQIQTVTVPYSDYCQNYFPGICDLPIDIEDDLIFYRIYLFLKVTNRPQAIKEFTEKYSMDQLSGIKTRKQTLFEDCGLKSKINQLEAFPERFHLKQAQFSVACGYLPQSYPNDIFIDLQGMDNRNTFIVIHKPDSISQYNRTLKGSAINVGRPQFTNWMV